MQEHFVALSTARDAVIAGDLDAARERLVWLAEHEATPELPETWVGYVGSMRNAAKRANAGTNATEVGRGIARVAAECGACHTEMKQGPSFEAEPVAVEGDTTKDHMQRHAAASELMWQGLISGDDVAWVTGATALTHQDPLKDLHHPKGTDAPESATALAGRVHALGSEGLAKLEPLERAKLYGDLIGTCAACHVAQGVAPGAE